MTDKTAADAHRATGQIGRRLLALCVDWALCSAISAGFFEFDPLATLAIFVAMRVLLTATLGSSFGQRLLGLGVRRLDGRVPSILQGLMRTLALCLVLPAGVTSKEDGRGMHDVWAGTTIIRLGAG